MNSFSRRIRVTGFLTLLCILLLSTTAMAAQTADSQSTANQQSWSVETDNQMKKNSTGTVATASEATMSDEVGPGIEKKVQPQPEEKAPTGPVYERGASLGIFSATAYCPSSSGRQQKTYSGTIPQPLHTLSADLTVLPLGTKVMIDGVIYTVEDTGSGIRGKKVDIYFGSRGEALAFGRQSIEIFAVVER
ncbi:3D domain-containing protein [Lacrimispora sp. 38-1]|uniref:3D domain-containing protein n=1 Tax=Lacrimispora sp. 38-1 TaxID=3125778 RepID=UPI003CE6B090